MRAFKVDKVDTSQGFPLLCGVLETELRTGDTVAVVDGKGKREEGTVSAIAVDDPSEGSIGARLLDHAKAGQAVRVAIRRPQHASSIEPVAITAVDRV
ncbi:MAG TPA: hypothetical protein VF407_14275 [Polyangiaceae bacterium]